MASSARQNHSARRAALAATATETRQVLPQLLKQRPDLAPSKSMAMYLDTLSPLRQADCPKHKKTAINIVNEDTWNAAIHLQTISSGKVPQASRVVVLNMASHRHPGGGWLKGATAQEEALCYRSSLSLSLHQRHYPFKQHMGLYSPDVVVIRADMASGHKLLFPEVNVQDLPVFSVVSIAGLCRPEVTKAGTAVASSSGGGGRDDTEVAPEGKGKAILQGDTDVASQEQNENHNNSMDEVPSESNAKGTRRPKEKMVYAKASDRTLTKNKMRLCLRTVASQGHSLLVLGALGCGAFHNPPEEVANCWLEVLREPEFEGGWWEAVWFAVFDRRNEGNFEVFDAVLGGQEV